MKLKKLLLLLLFDIILLKIKIIYSTFGIDTSMQTCMSGISLNDWNCLINNGFSFAIIEVWNGGYGYNINISNCVDDAWNAGMKHVDVYAFICLNCGYTASNAVSTIVTNLRNSNVNFGMLWFDVEQCSGCWSTNYSSNVLFLQEAVSEAQKLGINIGIYSSKYEWSETVGNDDSFSNFPLWYAHYDDEPSFDDTSYYEFGGWTKPAMKQYYNSGPCFNVDVDWYPNTTSTTSTTILTSSSTTSSTSSTTSSISSSTTSSTSSSTTLSTSSSTTIITSGNNKYLKNLFFIFDLIFLIINK
jgi:GH25 family lysozyme M1 (1,4-beta-N-acetylmuramidase)